MNRFTSDYTHNVTCNTQECHEAPSKQVIVGVESYHHEDDFRDVVDIQMLDMWSCEKVGQ